MVKLNKDFLAGAALGFGAGYIARGSKYLQSTSFREMLKSAMKNGMLGVEKAKEEILLAKESFEDMMVEARAEIDEDQKPQKTSAKVTQMPKRKKSTASKSTNENVHTH